MLGRYVPEMNEVLAVCQELIKETPSGSLNPSLVWNASWYGKIQLAATLLWNLAGAR